MERLFDLLNRVPPNEVQKLWFCYYFLYAKTNPFIPDRIERGTLSSKFQIVRASMHQWQKTMLNDTARVFVVVSHFAPNWRYVFVYQQKSIHCLKVSKKNCNFKLELNFFRPFGFSEQKNHSSLTFHVSGMNYAWRVAKKFQQQVHWFDV